ncbi:CPBP family intramembrane glutamic endopeptidase [Gilvibacter sediminis]|uniref:CPBP family intramembrane glutamic endopeptidase n=1 Tax=Gilvibacter sediminis TaxID=379071 RepID=UPI002350B1A5|nr:CPBP family intramembrane glutamic endopeptidase [Gilvibacter sediminis]MDC7998071.1 CPBP family intramembrane metalloprotease [Gilvibacter sediminis]
MRNKYLLAAEFLIFFAILPVSFAWDYSIWIKAGLAVVGLTYIIVQLVKDPDKPLKWYKNYPWKAFWKRIGLQFLIIGAVTTLFVLWKAPNSLFCVPKSDPELFVKILGVYTFLSVWPQELIYRTYFFSRFESLFASKKVLIFVNAVVFSLAHIFFRNTLVTVLTFIGGLLFAYTYFKTRSTLLVSIEHAVYGNWLFTVGMGDMLAFPGMDACAA